MSLWYVQLWFDWNGLRLWKSLFRHLTLSSELSVPYDQAVEHWILANRGSFSRSQMNTVRGMLDDLKNGMPLHVFLREKLGGMPDDVRSFLALATDESTLPAFLRASERMLEDQILRRAAIRGAVAYPLSVLTILTLVVSVYRWKVMPTFSAILAALGVGLPLSLRISDLAAHYMPVGLFLFGFFAVLLVLLWKSGARARIESAVFRIPFAGDWILLNERVRLLSALTSLSAAPIPKLAAMERISDRLRTQHCRREWAQVVERMRQGERWGQPGEGMQLVTPDIQFVLNLLPRSDEAVALLQATHDHYDARREQYLRLWLRSLEPALILLLGLFVSFLVYSMYRPLFMVVSLVGQ